LDAGTHDDHLDAFEFGGPSRGFLNHLGNVADEGVLDSGFHGIEGVRLFLRVIHSYL
jgi:hypothetical protein